MAQPMDSKTDQCWENNLETLSEWLKSLRITEEDISNKTIEIEIMDIMSTALEQAVQNKQIVIYKSMCYDLKSLGLDQRTTLVLE